MKHEIMRKNMPKQRKRKVPLIKVGDTVQVMAGKDKGQVGKILKVDWKNERVIVEGLNKMYRNTKPNSTNQQGGRFLVEMPIHYSNVLLYNPSLKKGVRIRVERNEDRTKRRICTKTSEAIG